MARGVEGKFDSTGTYARVESAGHYDVAAEEEGVEANVEMEHGSGPQGLRRLGKKFVHLTSRLRKHYTAKKAA